MNIWWRERADKKYKRIVYYGFGDKKYIVEGWKEIGRAHV